MSDVLVDVNPELVVYRVNGVWAWRSGKPMDRTHVVGVLIDLAARMDVRRNMLLEAAYQLRQGPTHENGSDR
jgi:hypothetical protein